MQKLSRGIASISRFAGQAAMHVYLVVALLSIYEVVRRYLFNAPTTWSYEVVLGLCAAAWALSGSYVALQKRHISISLLHDMAPPRVRRALDMLAAGFSLVALGFLAFLSFDLAAKALRWVDRTGSAFNSPLPTLTKCLLFVGAVLFILQVIADLLRLINMARTGTYDAD